MKAAYVLHLYLGAKCQMDDGKVGYLASVNWCLPDKSISMLTIRFSDDDEDWSVYNDDEKFHRIKLILRPISSITNEEARIWKSLGGSYAVTNPKYAIESMLRGMGGEHDGVRPAELVHYLISRGFDIFNLHESGECLYETDLKL